MTTKVCPSPAPADVLARMKPGHRYPAYGIAQLMNCTAQALQPVLATLVERGQLTKGRSPARKNTLFCIAGTEPAASDDPKSDPTIATPRRPILLTGELTNYVEPINRHRELCMLARNVR